MTSIQHVAGQSHVALQQVLEAAHDIALCGHQTDCALYLYCAGCKTAAGCYPEGLC